MDTLILTNDQSHSVFSNRFKEPYHSKFGAIQESLHIFIHAGLEERIFDQDEVRILEIGLGTGLNALLTHIAAAKLRKTIHYTALEPYPLDVSVTSSLNYPEVLQVSDIFLRSIHECSWDKAQEVFPEFYFRKIKNRLEEWHPDELFDVIYFDAFSPDTQPELWTEAIFQKLYQALSENGVLVTYSAKGAVKRAMKTSGFLVEKLPGPPGKREMTRGRKA